MSFVLLVVDIVVGVVLLFLFDLLYFCFLIYCTGIDFDRNLRFHRFVYNETGDPTTTRSMVVSKNSLQKDLQQLKNTIQYSWSN